MAKLAGAAMFAPMVNPYDSMMNREEKYGTWGKWTRRRKFMYFLARRFPSLLAYFYHRSFLSGKHEQIDKWLSLSLGRRVRFSIFYFLIILKFFGEKDDHLLIFYGFFFLDISSDFLVSWFKNFVSTTLPCCHTMIFLQVMA